MPNFLPEGNAVKPGDDELRTLWKIASLAGGPAGTASNQVYQDHEGSAPDDPTKPALSYSTGGTIYTWDVASQAWL